MNALAGVLSSNPIKLAQKIRLEFVVANKCYFAIQKLHHFKILSKKCETSDVQDY